MSLSVTDKKKTGNEERHALCVFAHLSCHHLDPGGFGDFLFFLFFLFGQQRYTYYYTTVPLDTLMIWRKIIAVALHMLVVLVMHMRFQLHATWRHRVSFYHILSQHQYRAARYDMPGQLAPGKSVTLAIQVQRHQLRQIGDWIHLLICSFVHLFFPVRPEPLVFRPVVMANQVFSFMSCSSRHHYCSMDDSNRALAKSSTAPFSGSRSSDRITVVTSGSAIKSRCFP